MSSNPIGWFEIYVDDISRAKKFYENVFGVELRKLDAPFPEIELWAFPMKQNQYGASGALVRMADCPAGRNSTLVYFNCTDCAVEEGRVSLRADESRRQKCPLASTGSSP